MKVEYAAGEIGKVRYPLVPQPGYAAFKKRNQYGSRAQAHTLEQARFYQRSAALVRGCCLAEAVPGDDDDDRDGGRNTQNLKQDADIPLLPINCGRGSARGRVTELDHEHQLASDRDSEDADRRSECDGGDEAGDDIPALPTRGQKH